MLGLKLMLLEELPAEGEASSSSLSMVITSSWTDITELFRCRTRLKTAPNSQMGFLLSELSHLKRGEEKSFG